jgi:hypothetical protein
MKHCSGTIGLALDQVQHLLRLYVEALTGREVDVAALAAVPDESRIGDGRTIHLPSVINEFGDEELISVSIKFLAAHAAGQIEFGTYLAATHSLRRIERFQKTTRRKTSTQLTRLRYLMKWSIRLMLQRPRGRFHPLKTLAFNRSYDFSRCLSWRGEFLERWRMVVSIGDCVTSIADCGATSILFANI